MRFLRFLLPVCLFFGIFFGLVVTTASLAGASTVPTCVVELSGVAVHVLWLFAIFVSL